MGSRLQHTLDAFSEEIEEGPTDLQDVALVAALDSALAKPVKLRTTRGQRILCFIPLPPCSSAIIWPLGALGIGALGAGALGAGALGAGVLGAGALGAGAMGAIGSNLGRPTAGGPSQSTGGGIPAGFTPCDCCRGGRPSICDRLADFDCRYC